VIDYPASEMPDSIQQQPQAAALPRTGKRERLVAAAGRLLHEQGIERTTLADIAQAADVPAGNVYYYFKTKDEIIAAVIDAHAQNLLATTAAIAGRHSTPKARLKALVSVLGDQGEIIASHGCPHGSLCSELDKRSIASGPDAARLMQIPLDWAEEQFRLMGRADARELAFDLMAGYQGSALLTNTFRDPAAMTGAARRLERWIDSLG
jgi:TetR/AcrR family transcriptional regulator, transcriptional repressor for nem operon